MAVELGPAAAGSVIQFFADRVDDSLSDDHDPMAAGEYLTAGAVRTKKDPDRLYGRILNVLFCCLDRAIPVFGKYIILGFKAV